MRLADIDMAADRDFIPVERAIEVAEASGADWSRTDISLNIAVAGKRGSYRISRDGRVDARGLRRLGLRP